MCPRIGRLITSSLIFNSEIQKIFISRKYLLRLLNGTFILKLMKINNSTPFDICELQGEARGWQTTLSSDNSLYFIVRSLQSDGYICLYFWTFSSGLCESAWLWPDPRWRESRRKRVILPSFHIDFDNSKRGVNAILMFWNLYLVFHLIFYRISRMWVSSKEIFQWWIIWIKGLFYIR